MKKIILYILGCIFSSIGLLISCTSSEEDLYGSFSGIVTDADTKQPLNGVSVSITPQGETKVTGSDGAYTFLELAPTEYTVAYKRDGYEPDTKKVKIEAGISSRVDMVLTPLRPKLTVSTDILEFGEENRHYQYRQGHIAMANNRRHRVAGMQTADGKDRERSLFSSRYCVTRRLAKGRLFAHICLLVQRWKCRYQSKYVRQRMRTASVSARD
jgi:hypothetical protein